MKKINLKNKIFFFAFFLLFVFGGYSEVDKFDSLISRKEKRIMNYKEEIAGGKPIPLTYKLFYSGSRENYCVFYDHSGHEAYFQFRQNKFDTPGNNILKFLSPGGAYEVSGEFLGLIVFSDKGISPSGKFRLKEVKLEKSEWLSKDSIPVYKLTKFHSLALDIILH